jgi:arylsulfatase A-like enzyme
MKKMSFLLFLVVLSVNSQAQQKPNIVYILADDLGIGDVSAYNPTGKIHTPAIDQLATEGVRFTDAHTSSSVCTPTRYGILTGRYNWRSRLKSGVLYGYDTTLLDPNRQTVASFLQKQGYETGIVGKWHLGWNWANGKAGQAKVDFSKPVRNSPNTFGFGYSFCIAGSLDMPPYVYVENGQPTSIPIDTIAAGTGVAFYRGGLIATDFKHEEVLGKFTDKAVGFINQKAQSKTPFFLYLPLAAPHTPILPTGSYVGKSQQSPYADFTIMVDDVVKKVVNALKANGIYDNTLIVFTSDNGFSPAADLKAQLANGHNPNMQFRGHKADLFEGGHRVPFIVRWGNQIKKASVDSQLVCSTDLFRAVSDLLNVKLGEDTAEDSYSFLSALTRKKSTLPKRTDIVHHSVDGFFAIRKDNWKLLFCSHSGGWSDPRPNSEQAKTLPPIQLYNLSNDLGETQNVSAQHPRIVRELTDLMTNYLKRGRSTEGRIRANDGPIFWKQLTWLKEREADIIIYGGTSAAITAAVQAKRMGKSVIVVSPDTHLGGLSSGGLGFTDTGNKEVIGGLSREFYQRIYNHYQKPKNWQWQKREEYGNKGQGTPAMDGNARTMWIFEPHAAEQVFEDFVKENDITVYRNAWLDRSPEGIEKKQGNIQSFRTLDGITYKGKMFIEATYEGDLMALAGVKYHIGREPNSQYNEKWNGVQGGIFHQTHHFETKVSPYKIEGDATSGLLPEISPDPIPENGSGDAKIQAYCFRMCLSNHPDNRIPFPKPEGYDPARYELYARVYATGWRRTFVKFDPIPNRKTDTNNHGPFSTDYLGKNYDYPEATYERRKEIIKDHELYQKGMMYFLQNDPRVPADVQEKMKEWGLARDEFKENGGWPHQLYIREARRMIGAFVMTEADALGKTQVPNPIGMGSYTLDSHNTQRYVTAEGYVQNEGDIAVGPDRPYSIAYGSILPKENECTNLLVPICISSSHIAYGSIRMEPVFMILGQSAATAAVLSINHKLSPQQLPYQKLKDALLKSKQILEK